jgi:NADPH-dependent 2,4-dienoyl-CoA reductase/sulfur reductase-like enzyme/nitrite reductase/ring-hydroxylating ferredoxin subunit
MEGASMSDAETKKTPDLSLGVAIADFPANGLLAGHVGEDAVLLVKSGADFYAIGATCSHYGGPLADGILVGETIRCPWHHACFALKTGTPLRPPALKDLACWRIERRDGRIYVREKLPEPARPSLAPQSLPASIVIIGGGAAGNMAAETLRREGYQGPVTIISADTDAPYDRPVLSKDYLAGHAPEDWVPLRSPEFYAEQKIDLRLGTHVSGIDVAKKTLHLETGDGDEAQLPYGALLIATGAEPVRLDIPGANLPHVHVLRSLADCNAILADAKGAKTCVVIGASFIGLEAASSLRQRELTVHVVAPDHLPMAKTMGDVIGETVLAFHKSKGVIFHLETKPVAIQANSVTLANGEKIAADLVIVGVGVRPALALAQSAGLAIDRGVLVDDYLQTSAKAIYAAGDIARWPDPHSGSRLRVEHWIVAERQGQVSARNMLGRRERFDAVPFFWSQQYDASINYVGHAEDWDDIKIEGDVAARDFVATFVKDGKTLAVVSMGRDRESLLAEVALEKTIA